MDDAELVRKYYRAIDDGAYAALSDLLADGFVHDRPDRTVEGREAFVSFMRSGRPETDTEHVLETVYEDGESRIAAEGRLLRPDGAEWFGFVDAFEVGEGGLLGLRTYTDAT